MASLRRRQLTLTIAIASLSLAFFVLSAGPGRAVYNEPSSKPTELVPNPALQFLNGADYPQQKLGSLIVGRGGGISNERQLCLNGTATYVAGSGGSCISSWSQIVGTVEGRLRLSTLGAGAGGVLADYTTIDNGFIRLQNQSLNGAYSLITANASPAPTGSTALLAMSNSTSSYAGYFSGRLWVGSLAGVAGQLCLNGAQAFNATTRTGHCIQAWTDLIFRGGVGWWRLQSSPMTPDSGRIALTNSFLTGTLIVGDAAAVGSQYTCGDGLCSGDESAGSCSLDCAAIPAPSAMTATPGDRQATVQFNGAAGNAYVLTRQTDTATVWQPMDGVAYTAPTVSGPATIVGVGTVPVGGAVQFIDSGLTNGTVYTYYAWQANAFPRYSVQASAAVTPVASTVLTVARAGSPGASSIGTIDGFIDCPATACSHAYNAGTSVTLAATPATGYAFTGWSGGGCSGAGQCTLTISASITVTGTFQPKYTVSVTPPGAGGVVTNTAPLPANQINCGITCSREFPATTTITLRATPAGGYLFSGWDGAGCAGNGLCAFVLNDNVTVTATFTADDGGGGGGGGGIKT